MPKANITRNPPELVEKFVSENLLLVPHTLAKYFRFFPESIREDAIADGNIILLKCARNFDASRGFQFSTYVVRSLRMYFLDYLHRKHKNPKEVSLSAPVRSKGGNMVLSDTLFDPRSIPEPIEDEFITKALSILRERDREIFIDRVVSGLTLETISEKHGISKERVRQIFNQATTFLQDKFQIA